MYRIIMFSMFYVFLFIETFSQAIVVDPGLSATIAVQTYVENDNYKGIQEKQNAIRNAQLLINIQLNEIRELEIKIQSYLSSVSSIVRNSKDIIYAYKLIEEIAYYQSIALQNALGDPKLTIVAAKSQVELVNRGNDLIISIINVLTGGKENMLNNKERTDMIQHIVKELRLMRGLAYRVARQIKTAQRDGIWKQLFYKEFRYYVNSRNIVNGILKDVKYVKNGGKY